MFYLSHLYLSGDCPYTIVGNFVKEFNTNWDYSEYHKLYKKGVILNDKINEFSESHPLVLQCQKRFSKNAKQSYKATYIFFDHLLAANWEKYSDKDLKEFATDTYNILMDHCVNFPYKLKMVFPRLLGNDWLYQFRTLQGVNNSIKQFGIVNSRPWNMDSSLVDFINNYAAFKADFDEFFAELMEYVDVVKQEMQEEFTSEKNFSLKLESIKELKERNANIAKTANLN
ncbi:MAG: ACP phosphodiesterase [Cytophagaceae bacterium]